MGSFTLITQRTVEDQEFLVNPQMIINMDDLAYSMMFIQKFKQLYDASCKLHKIGYYKNGQPSTTRSSKDKAIRRTKNFLKKEKTS